MKIGIITHHYINNFGAFLQTYALQEKMKKIFPNDDIYVINYISIKHYIINTLGCFRFNIHKENLESWLEKIQLPITFYKTRQKFLKMTKRCFSVKQINGMKFDCIIIGSDEVWNFQDRKGNNKVKFGYGLNCNNITAYAPSVGNIDITTKIPKYIWNGINNFNNLSARDKLTEELIYKITGNFPEKVLDPTFLFDFPIEIKTIYKKPYILFYYCDQMPSKCIKLIVEFAKKHQYFIYGAGEYNKIYSDITVNITPFDWVQMFRDASYIFTGTFHGVVFSILHKKQFLCYLTNKSRIQKVNSLLSDFNIENRNIRNENDIIKLSKKNIDYNKVYKKIELLKEKSHKYLLTIVK